LKKKGGVGKIPSSIIFGMPPIAAGMNARLKIQSIEIPP